MARINRRPTLFTAVLALSACLLPAARAATPQVQAAIRSDDLAEVLRRAGDEVGRRAQESSVIVADEECGQRGFKDEAEGWGPGRPGNMDGVVRTSDRRWKAELAMLLVQPDGQHTSDVPWVEVRDVSEVDGKPLPDRNARLERLFQSDPNWKTTKLRGSSTRTPGTTSDPGAGPSIRRASRSSCSILPISSASPSERPARRP